MENRDTGKEVQFTAFNDQNLEVGYSVDIKGIHELTPSLLVGTKFVCWVNNNGQRVAAYFAKKGKE